MLLFFSPFCCSVSTDYNILCSTANDMFWKLMKMNKRRTWTFIRLNLPKNHSIFPIPIHNKQHKCMYVLPAGVKWNPMCCFSIIMMSMMMMPMTHSFPFHLWLYYLINKLFIWMKKLGSSFQIQWQRIIFREK